MKGVGAQLVGLVLELILEGGSESDEGVAINGVIGNGHQAAKRASQ
nr:hypothetical protein OG781_40780 [Streptomyces sp. NBC_00830]